MTDNDDNQPVLRFFNKEKNRFLAQLLDRQELMNNDYKILDWSIGDDGLILITLKKTPKQQLLAQKTTYLKDNKELLKIELDCTNGDIVEMSFNHPKGVNGDVLVYGDMPFEPGQVWSTELTKWVWPDND